MENRRSAMPEKRCTVRLELPSLPAMVDVVAVVGTQVGRRLGFDEESVHGINLALHEAVVNAIEHGNKADVSKPVIVEFVMVPADAPSELILTVRDCGDGFDPDQVPDPLALENVPKGSGRGLLFMRRLMDDVRISRPRGGGTEVRLVKALRAHRGSH
jgi:serine/threonine-protein kinase RsbW